MTEIRGRQLPIAFVRGQENWRALTGLGVITGCLALSASALRMFLILDTLEHYLTRLK